MFKLVYSISVVKNFPGLHPGPHYHPIRTLSPHPSRAPLTNVSLIKHWLPPISIPGYATETDVHLPWMRLEV